MASCELERLLANLYFGAFACAGSSERRLQLRFVGRRSLDPEAAVGAEDPVRLRATRLRAVDEEVDERVVFDKRRRRRWAQLEQPPLQLLDPGACCARDVVDPQHALVADVEDRWFRQEVD